MRSHWRAPLSPGGSSGRPTTTSAKGDMISPRTEIGFYITKNMPNIMHIVSAAGTINRNVRLFVDYHPLHEIHLDRIRVVRENVDSQ